MAWTQPKTAWIYWRERVLLSDDGVTDLDVVFPPLNQQVTPEEPSDGP